MQSAGVSVALHPLHLFSRRCLHQGDLLPLGQGGAAGVCINPPARVRVSCSLAGFAGYNFYGMLGDGTSASAGDSGASSRKTPTPVKGGYAFSLLSAGVYHTCGLLKSDGVAFCWGECGAVHAYSMLTMHRLGQALHASV